MKTVRCRSISAERNDKYPTSVPPDAGTVERVLKVNFLGWSVPLSYNACQSHIPGCLGLSHIRLFQRDGPRKRIYCHSWCPYTGEHSDGVPCESEALQK